LGPEQSPSGYYPNDIVAPFVKISHPGYIKIEEDSLFTSGYFKNFNRRFERHPPFFLSEMTVAFIPVIFI